MKFCSQHWDSLRAAVAERGLAHLIAADGSAAARRMADEVESGKQSLANFDPLMSAHWAIVGNVTKQIGPSVLYLMQDGVPEDPVEYPGYEDRTWPRCPLCYINLAHEVSCADKGCTLEKVNGFDWMIERAADDAKAKAAQILADEVGGESE